MRKKRFHRQLTKTLLISFCLTLCNCTKPKQGIKDADLAPVSIILEFPGGVLKAGVASADVTPKKPQYLAGFGPGRKSKGINDPIFARAVVFEQGGERVAFVSIDAIGVQRHHLAQYLDKIHKVRKERVIIACTHDHSAPDTMGLWGKVYGSDGRDMEYIEFLTKKVGEVVDKAVDSLEPVELVFGEAFLPEKGVVRNTREPGLLDREIGIIGIYPKGASIPKAVLVNFAMHAETLWDDNLMITSDWPGYMRRELERLSGAELSIYFNGAQGAMVTVDNLIDEEGKEVHSFFEAERVGKAVAEAGFLALRNGKKEKSPRIVFGKRIFYVPVDNPLYNTVSHLTRKLTRDFYRGHFQTEVNYLKIGELCAITIPGEAYPKIGLELKKAMDCEYKWVIGLANDERGYLIYPEDYFNPLYSYERSASMSAHWGGLIVEQNAISLILSIR